MTEIDTLTRKSINKEQWVEKQIHLLQIEKNLEIESSKFQCEGQSLKEQEFNGVILSNLVISEKSTGLFGRPMLKFSARLVSGKSVDLPSHTFSSGDIIGISEQGKNLSCNQISAVVTRTARTHITVVLDSETSELTDVKDDGLFRICKLANNVVYRRINKSLQRLGSNVCGRAKHLIGVLFEEECIYNPLSFIPSELCSPCSNGSLNLFNKNLDKTQLCAVQFSLLQKDLAVIHGPPGTGKTTTLIEVIIQHVKLGNKVLSVAPSNLAVDNLLERLVSAGVKVVRMGHPARATPQAQLRSLDALIQTSDEYSVLKDVRADVTDSVNKLGRTNDKRHRMKLKADIKSFRKELREREIRLSKQIIKQCDVTLATLTSSGDDGPLRHIEENFFDVTVIDECSQGLEASCYMSIMKSPKLILAGDHRQLPPTVFSTAAASEGLLLSLMERVVDTYGDSVTKMLKVQYRMNSSIMSWASAALYNSELYAHPSVCSHLLCQLTGVETNEDTERSLILIDTCGCDFEEFSGDKMSKGNEGEAAVVTSHVKNLIRAGVNPTDIAVITPYNLQVEFIRNLLHKDFPSVEVRSVDGFQGREKEAVVLSLVRSNDEGEIGFLAEDRRLNVAVTRARRHLAVVCDTNTVCQHSFIKGLFDHITEKGDVRSAMEYITDDICISNFNKPICKPVDSKLVKLGQSTQPKCPEEVEADNAKRREKLTEILSTFLTSDDFTMRFDPNLNAFERRLVHEIAEKFNLSHISAGEGKARRIIVKKHILEEECNDKKESSNKFCLPIVTVNTTNIGVIGEDIVLEEEINKPLSPVDTSGFQKLTNVEPDKFLVYPINNEKSENNTHNIKNTMNVAPKHKKNSRKNKKTESSPSDTKICIICKKNILLANVQVHSFHCEKLRKDKLLLDEISREKARNISIAKNAASGTKTNVEHFNAVTDAFQKDNNSCSFPRCKNKTIILLQICNFCRNTFCLSHHLAEVHGCGEQARRQARINIPKQIKNGVLLPGSGIPTQKSSEANRAQLHKKLQSKIEKNVSRRKKNKKADS